MRRIRKAILHCSATPEGKEFNASDIRKWHVDGNGWSDIGYHFVILLDGTVEIGRPLERVGAHVRGENNDSVGICYIGGVDDEGEPKDTMTPEQEQAFKNLAVALKAMFPRIYFRGHNEYANKACPSFDVREKFPNL